jgi:hypothetical protein
VSGPHAHDNLTVWLIHSDDRDERDFLTLDEGLAQKLVAVSEQASAQVNQLLIENLSDRPLFLQEGDRVRGGQQDRTIHTSIVIPAKSGKMPIPAFCVEPSRWTGAAKFEGTANGALAQKSVRMAAKIHSDQGAVWREVAHEKAELAKSLAAPSATSSLNETVDSAAAKRVSDECVAALAKVLDGEKDAVGVAIAVNGKLEEIDLYPGHALLRKLYPRLLAAYALDAASRKDKPAAPPPSVEDVVRFYESGDAPADKRAERVDDRNGCEISGWKDKVRCETSYDGRAVHRQVLAR